MTPISRSWALQIAVSMYKEGIITQEKLITWIHHLNSQIIKLKLFESPLRISIIVRTTWGGMIVDHLRALNP